MGLKKKKDYCGVYLYMLSCMKINTVSGLFHYYKQIVQTAFA